MALKLGSDLRKRQTNDGSMSGPYDDGSSYDSDDNGDYSWWWSPTGMAVRYSIIILLFASILIFFVGGYLHARRRIRKGLPPLPYHRWMVYRSVRHQPQYNPYYPQNPYQQPHQQESYAMPGYAPAPPAYNTHVPPPPAYTPPEGASKAMPDQSLHGVQTHRPEQAGGEGSAFMAVPAARQ